MTLAKRLQAAWFEQHWYRESPAELRRVREARWLRRAAELGAFGLPGIEPPADPLHGPRGGEHGAALVNATLRRTLDRPASQAAPTTARPAASGYEVPGGRAQAPSREPAQPTVRDTLGR